MAVFRAAGKALPLQTRYAHSSRSVDCCTDLQLQTTSAACSDHTPSNAQAQRHRGMANDEEDRLETMSPAYQVMDQKSLLTLFTSSRSIQACLSTSQRSAIKFSRSTADNSPLTSHFKQVRRWQLAVWPLRTSNISASFGLMIRYLQRLAEKTLENLYL